MPDRRIITNSLPLLLYIGKQAHLSPNHNTCIAWLLVSTPEGIMELADKSCENEGCLVGPHILQSKSYTSEEQEAKVSQAKAWIPEGAANKELIPARNHHHHQGTGENWSTERSSMLSGP